MPTPSRHVLVALVLVALVLLVVTSGVVERVWQRRAGLLEPWQRALAARGLPGAGGRDANEAAELIAKRSEVRDLRARLAEYTTIQDEGLVDPREVLLPSRARIVARSARQGRRYCEIDLGELDGVEKGMAVIIGWSLVAVVDRVSEGRSLVRQLTDSESRIPALLMDGEEVLAEGVLAGTGKRGVLTLEFVEDRPGLQVAPGQAVVSAALPPAVPRGLALGAVTAATRSSTSDHWRVEVAPLHVVEAHDSVALLRPAVSPP